VTRECITTSNREKLEEEWSTWRDALLRIVTGSVADVSEVYFEPVFMVEMSRMVECPCM
jgi:hypothetical protein